MLAYRFDGMGNTWVWSVLLFTKILALIVKHKIFWNEILEIYFNEVARSSLSPSLPTFLPFFLQASCSPGWPPTLYLAFQITSLCLLKAKNVCM